jgi:hypothetical protein
MATLVPAYAPAAAGPTASQYPPVERPERTEILGELTPAMPLDAVPTRTHVPLAEVNRPASLTPPPVVDAGRRSSATAPRGRVPRIAALMAGAVALVVLAGVAVRRGAAVQPAGTAVAARPMAVPTPSAPVAPVSPVAPAAPSTGSGPLSAEPAPTQPSAPPQSALLPPAAALPAPTHTAVTQNSPVIPTAKPASSAPVGPFLRAISTAPAAAAKPKPKAKHLDSAMPASGL